MYGTTTSVGGSLAVTGLSIGSHALTAIGMIFAGGALLMLARKPRAVRP